MTEGNDTRHSVGTIGIIGRGVDVAPVFRAGFGVTFLLAAAGTGARVAIPILLQQAIDHGFSGPEVRVDYVLRLVLIGACVVVVASLCQRMAVTRLGQRAEQGMFLLRTKLFDHIHRLSLADHNEERRGALVSRVTSDIETLQMFFSWGALAFLLDGTLMLVVASVMLAYDWVLAVVAFVVAMPLAIVLRLVQSRLAKAYERVRESNATVMGVVSEFAASAETLHAYGAIASAHDDVASATRQRTRAWNRSTVLGALLFPSGEVFSVLSVLAVVTVGFLRGPSSGLTSGAMVGFIFLTYRFLEPVGEFTEVLDQSQTAVAGLRRVLSVLDTPVGPPEPLPHDAVRLPVGPLAVDVQHVTFAYDTRKGVTAEIDDDIVLNDVTVHVPAGQLVALVGSTGSGKTTLGRLVARFADPVSGSVLLGGVNLRRVRNTELRSRLVVVPQEPFLFGGSIAMNLEFSRPGVTHLEMHDAFESLDLIEWLSSMPDGLETAVGHRGSALSAGERQLVALVRAAIVDPDVLILDEATSSVDALTEVRLSHALERLSDGRTTIAIAHRLSTAVRADRVLVLQHGRLVEDGSHPELIARGGTYSQMYSAWVASTSLET